MKNMFISLAFLMSCAGSAHAFLSTKDTLDWLDKEGEQAFAASMYLGGIAESYWVASVSGSNQGKTLICLPEGQNLQTEELRLLAQLSLKKYVNSFRNDSEEQQEKEEFLAAPVSMALFLAWQAEFPCT